MADEVPAGAGGSGSGYPAGWYPDPQRVYEQRYYDGTAWTAQVMSAGVTGYDQAAAAPAALSSPAAVSSLGGRYPAASGLPTRRIGQNRLGAGFVMACLGWFTLVVATQMDWLAGQALFDLNDGGAVFNAANVSFTDNVQRQAIWGVILMLLVVIATTLPYQPGKIMGLFYGGCIGLAVCWNKLDANSTSIRSNILGAFVVLVTAASVWFQLNMVTSEVPRYADAAYGPGFWTFLGGLALLLVGALVGRRHVRIEV